MRAALLLAAGALLVGCPGPGWRVALDGGELDRTVLGLWGAGPRDVYAVGGGLGNGQEALALHFDGAGWRELHPGSADTLWWAAGSGPADVWMVGTHGRLLHWDGAAFTERASGTMATLWGAWAASPTDAWAVGGTPGGGRAAASDNDLVLHWDGAAWTREALPRTLGVALFKIWGTSSENLYAVGEGGVIWHRTASGWRLESDATLSTDTLLTVSGCGEREAYAVGGQDVLRTDGAGWTREPLALRGRANGVACDGNSVVVVGSGGLKWRKAGGAWVDESATAPYADLHVTWPDGQGAWWAGGGDFVTPPAPGKPRDGVVARYGQGNVPSQLSR